MPFRDQAVITGDMPAPPLTSLLQTCTTSVAIPMTPMAEDAIVAIRPAMIKIARRGTELLTDSLNQCVA